MTRIICRVDDAGYWTGESREVAPGEGWPHDWRLIAPPEDAEANNRWTDIGWVQDEERLPPPDPEPET